MSFSPKYQLLTSIFFTSQEVDDTVSIRAPCLGICRKKVYKVGALKVFVKSGGHAEWDMKEISMFCHFFEAFNALTLFLSCTFLIAWDGCVNER